MKSVIIVILAIGLAVIAALPTQWVELKQSSSLRKGSVGSVYSFCNNSDDNQRLIIWKVTLSPDPPEKGKDLTITVSYELNETLSSGEIKISAKDGFIPVDKTYSLCDLLAEEGLKCPVGKMSGTNSTTVSIPDFPGTVKGTAKAWDQKGQELMCIEFEL